MFDTKKFGAYISKLRKNEDMTQSELGDRLNLTRQAISKYEVGDSFPDISILILIADLFKVTLDELINSGEPTKGEAAVLGSVAKGNNDLPDHEISDIINLAPLLKPSVLGKMAQGLGEQGIDISNVVTLAEYLNDNSVMKLLEKTTFDSISVELLEKLMPFLDAKSKGVIFGKILDGVYDWHMIRIMIPHAEYMMDQIEEAVVEGALPWEALDVIHKCMSTVIRTEE